MKLIFTLTLFATLAGGVTAQAQTGATNQLVKKQTAEEIPAPRLVNKIPNFESDEPSGSVQVQLSTYFEVPGYPEATFTYSIQHISNDTIASVTIKQEAMTLAFLHPGQTNVILEAQNGEATAVDTFVIGVRPEINENYVIADLEELVLEPGTYWNGADLSGSFASGPVTFFNDYNPDWFAWSGWSYTTPGWGNQYSASVWADDRTNVYATSYVIPGSGIAIHDTLRWRINGLFVTNSAMAALSMQHGDDYAKKFGGENGDEEDWFKLIITGFLDQDSVGKVEFLLADYTPADHRNDYVIQTWQWVELSSLGEVDSLSFSLASTDNGDYGMNTPAYFCLDNICLEQIIEVSARQPISAKQAIVADLLVYPNPTTDYFRISSTNPMWEKGTRDLGTVEILDPVGRLVRRYTHVDAGQTLYINDQPAGTYFVRIQSGKETFVKKIMKYE